jgi:transposase
MHFSGSGIQVKELGATATVANVLRRLDFAGLVDRTVRWDERQWRLSPGKLASGLVINALAGRSPLYQVQAFYNELDTEGLFGRGVTADCFTDDALGQTLDRLHEAGPGMLYTKLATAAIGAFGLNCLNLHADTTSWSLAGAYEGEASTLTPARGHSKDRQPESKQFLYGLVVNREGIPLRGFVRDGNLSDKTWNGEAIDTLPGLLSSDELGKVIYVADAACVTPDNLRRFAALGVSFISRLPATYGLVAELKAAALAQGEWTVVGPLRQRKESASYKVQSFERTLYGRIYRFVVVHSTHLEQRKQHSIQRQAERERKDIEAAAAALGKTVFNCRIDAEREAQAFADKHQGFYAVSATVQEVTQIKRRPGRPKTGETPVEITTYRVQVELGELQSDLLQARRDEESLFILVTNLLDAPAHPPEAILREYKEQASVEVRFRFLKDPAFVDGFFVKDKGRLEALAYLMLVALLVYALIERLVRMGLREHKRSLIGVGGVKHEEPTGRVVLAILATIHVLLIRTPRGIERQLSDLTRPQQQTLDLLGISPEAYVAIVD